MITALLPAGARPGPGTVLPLDDDESHHLHVRRADHGAAIRLVDGRGTVASGTLEWSGRHARVRIEALDTLAPPPALVLAVGAGDKDRFGALVERAAEMGATQVVPLDTERARHVATRVRAEHAVRLQRRALEAIKQSGALVAPQVEEPKPLGVWLASLPPDAARWLADPAGGPPPPVPAGTAVAVAIGPEGGFTEAERAQLRAGGFRAIGLGASILRYDTAAIAAAAAVHLLRR